MRMALVTKTFGCGVSCCVSVWTARSVTPRSAAAAVAEEPTRLRHLSRSVFYLVESLRLRAAVLEGILCKAARPFRELAPRAVDASPIY